MQLNEIKSQPKTTPAFVFDDNIMRKNLGVLARLSKQSGCKVLYSVKALPLEPALRLANQYLDGLSVSSLFEARLAKETLDNEGSIHITTPGLRVDEFQQIRSCCTHISFNSIEQFKRLHNIGLDPCSIGLRINPKLSFVNDARFDPCRPYSKLGINIDSLDTIPEAIEGLHFHNVFSYTNYLPLIQTVSQLKEKFGVHLSGLKWLNLGGGYLYNEMTQHQVFIEMVEELRTKYGVEIYIEPGKALIGNACFLITTVIDRFCSDGKQILILDTSVNHNPEVFEYQRKPELLDDDENGSLSCILAGSSCLAGDVFGEYVFSELPKVGERLVFPNIGAYSLIKANRFNGYNFPDIYQVDSKNKMSLVKHSTYSQYRQQWKN